jgi:cytochrome c oxidase assembly protein subunit 15
VTWLHRYTRLLVAATLVLVTAGGMVTSTASGLSVPDWPTTYGYNMFTFPLGKMVGGIFYEHGHRLIATTVGLLTIGLVAFVWRVDSRRWMRRLSLVALAAVVLQGVLGGLTVIYLLPDAISIGHAGLAQVFFCLTIAIAVFTSRTWLAPAEASAALAADAALRRRLVVMTSLIYAQILIGATMRHTGAGLAIPDFPLVFGGLLPPAWTPGIAVHFAHRLGALVVTVFVLANVAHIWSRHGSRRELVRPAWLLVVTVAAQVALGATVVLSGKQEIVNTLHVAVGSIVLGASLVLTLRAFGPLSIADRRSAL